MSTARPITAGRPRPSNTAVLLRDAFTALNDLALARLAATGHGGVRAAHSAVFQHLDDTGTTVSALAERAGMTKQAMAELVTHLETNGYLTREPDPNDRRAKLVVPTARGREVVTIAQSTIPALEHSLAELLGAERHAQLRTALRAIIDSAGREHPAANSPEPG
ncbi:MarR family winged helix-turn-helix transcriptional regulator [Nocardia asteroides]|uniref:MarR family winged helix-turn-helix transcriptional regulator n=1 Tax=Nocardia asteroides TaxID=1824 RepID=UPI001E2E001C|nr:MarR family transcriptional regulator [Nocardia asteroides]UGT62497.1 MarR family transcriptional regulator [Nocardia asteroides]